MGAKSHAVGKSLAHDSANLHVRGAAAYTDDIPEPRDLLHIAIGMSSKAHAKITKLDLTAVLSASGVADVFVAADIPGENLCGPIVADERIFSDDVVEYAGQAIFAVAAESVDMARKAVRLATIEYKELEPILDPLEAVEKKSFVLPSETLQRGDADAALEAAPHRLKRRLDLGGQDQFYLEGHISMAVPGEDGTITVRSILTKYSILLQRLPGAVRKTWFVSAAAWAALLVARRARPRPSPALQR
jgi:xanthine dehydrogenase large subunit